VIVKDTVSNYTITGMTVGVEDVRQVTVGVGAEEEGNVVWGGGGFESGDDDDDEEEEEEEEDGGNEGKGKRKDKNKSKSSACLYEKSVVCKSKFEYRML